MKLISTFAAAAVAATAVPAFALAPNQVPVASRLDVAGATATNQSLGRLFLQTGGGCNGSIDVYTGAADPGTTADARVQAAFANANWAILCTPNATIGGTGIGIFKEGNGGSGNGVTPVATPGATLAFLDLGTGAAPPAPCASAGSVTGTGLQAATFWFGCTVTAPRHPTAGISDVNPSLLTTSKTVVNALTASPLVSVVFAPGVSLNLYRAMQENQGKEFACTSDDNGVNDGDGTSDCDEGPNVPSFTESQLRALFVQFTTSWGNLQSDNGTALNAGANPPGRDTVFICRRGDTSGTQATFEALLLNQRCVDGVYPMAIPDVLGSQAGGVAWAASHINETVFAGNNAGAVANCLNAHDANDDWAIGIISTETALPLLNGAGSTGAGGFRYVGINRANPDLVSVVSGNYELWTDNTWNTVGALAGVPGAISSYITGNFGARVPGDNVAFRHATGDGGLLAPPFAPNAPPVPPFTQATVRANPTNTASHAPTGSVNNCNPPVTFGVPTETGGEHEENNTFGE